MKDENTKTQGRKVPEEVGFQDKPEIYIGSVVYVDCGLDIRTCTDIFGHETPKDPQPENRRKLNQNDGSLWGKGVRLSI